MYILRTTMHLLSHVKMSRKTTTIWITWGIRISKHPNDSNSAFLRETSPPTLRIVKRSAVMNECPILFTWSELAAMEKKCTNLHFTLGLFAIRLNLNSNKMILLITDMEATLLLFKMKIHSKIPD